MPEPTNTTFDPSATTYEIDGFRSLRLFEIHLNPGMNVLVGPNGSGKTNFLDFLDFLDSALHIGATNAVSHIGGIAKCFSQENTSRKKAHLNAKVSGLADLRDLGAGEIDRPFFRFQYELEIRFSKAESAVYISGETLRLWKRASLEDPVALNQIVGAIHVTRKSPSEESAPAWKISKRLLTENDRNPLNIDYDTMFDLQREAERSKVQDRLPRLRASPDQSFLTGGHRFDFPALNAVRQSVTRGRSFNILPAKVREPDDITRPAGIQRDGSGLGSTLYALQSLKKNKRRVTRLPRARSETLDDIVELTKLVFPNLEGIHVVQDPHTGKFLPALHLDSEPSLKIPFQGISDGTLKWLALVSLILTSGSVFSLEEPENFLHPKMQQHLVELIRESFSDGRANGYFLFSTHSETLINFCRPEELIVFDFVDGATECSRIEDPGRLLEQINETGFGLGYYYASNALPKRAGVRRRKHGKTVRK